MSLFHFIDSARSKKTGFSDILCNQWLTIASLSGCDAIEGVQIADPAIRSMLARYVRECTGDAFGVYVGNEVEGEVRPLARSDAASLNTGDQG